MSARTAAAGAFLLALGQLVPGSTWANGRFPTANYVIVGPGARSNLLVLRTTFGLSVSRDYGRSWSWVCEDAYGAMGMFDPPLTLGMDSNLVTGLPDGLAVSGDQCAWSRPTGDPRVQVTDLAEDASGRRVVAALGPFGSPNGLQVSDDGGRSWRVGVRRERFFIETVEVAPSDPERVYVSGYETGGVAVLYRSDDGGRSMREVSRDFLGGVDVYVAAVDPRNPDVVWVRSNRDRGTLLLRSDEGGARLRRVAETRERMVGFALSDDGRTVWIGSSDRAEGILRAVDGGAFTRVRATVSVTCMRQHAGILYVCTDEAVDGFALGCSLDGGDRIDPILSLRDLTGPSLCPAGSAVAERCGPLWPAQRMTLLAIDGGAITRTYHEERPEPTPEPAPDAAPDAARDLGLELPLDGAPEAAGDLGPEAPPDVANDASVDIFDAATEPPVLDAAPEDRARDSAVTDAPGVDLLPSPDAPGDAPRDARDALTDRSVPGDAGPPPRTDTCGCEAPGLAAGRCLPWALLCLGLSARRRGPGRWRSRRLGDR